MVNDAIHVKELQVLFGLCDKSKTANAPSEVERELHADECEPLTTEKTSELRRAVGKLMWLSHDRRDLKFGVGRLAAQVGAPTESTWAEAKRMTRQRLTWKRGHGIRKDVRVQTDQVYVKSSSTHIQTVIGQQAGQTANR
eukprot:894475-Amphidinium_carterae.4